MGALGHLWACISTSRLTPFPLAADWPQGLMGDVQRDIFSWRDIDRAPRLAVNKGSTSTRASKFKNKGVRPRKCDPFHHQSKAGQHILIFYNICLINDQEFLSLVVVCDSGKCDTVYLAYHHLTVPLTALTYPPQHHYQKLFFSIFIRYKLFLYLIALCPYPPQPTRPTLEFPRHKQQQQDIYIIIFIMNPQPPFQPNFIINPQIYQQNNTSSNFVIVQHQHVSPHIERSVNHLNVFSNYTNPARSLSSSNPRPPLQPYTLAHTHQHTNLLPPKFIQIQQSKKIQGVLQQQKRLQFEQIGRRSSKQKQGGSKKEILINSCPNSNNKKTVVKQLIFPTSNQSNKQMKYSSQKKIDFYPKMEVYPKINIPNFQQINQLKIPLNNVQHHTARQIKSDNNIIERKQHTLIYNMSIPQNFKYKNQYFDFDSKANNQYKQLQSTSNSFQNIFIGQKQQNNNTLKVQSNQRIKKNFTQANFLPMSHSTSQLNQPNPRLVQNFSTTSKEKKELLNQDESFQFKKKNDFQFFKDIKKKSTFCAPPYSMQKQFQLNDFDLMDKLGKGAFGDVFIAQEKISGFICVIKKLSKKKIKEHKLEQQALRQIKIQSYFHHRHLTSLYGFFSDQEYIYIILQLLPDGSMIQMKKKRKVPQNQVSTYMRQITLGLTYMHTQNVIHRDIKPQNIFLYQGYAKIGDFGCSIYTSINRSTQIGSLAYLSPQQLKKEAYNQKIDVWSLGVMAYQMLIGTSPFEKDIIKIAKKQMAPELSELKFSDKVILSEQAKDFLVRMLDKDPQKRFGIQQVLEHQFIVKYVKQDQAKLQRLFG